MSPSTFHPSRTEHRRGADSSPLLSVVVPTLNEASTLPRLLDDLRRLTAPYEVVVADGGSADATLAAARAAGARVTVAAAGRGAQLRAGAAVARAELLCFLHADARLDAPAAAALDELARTRPAGAFAFRLAIDASGAAYRLVEWGANARSRWLRLPYGDQGLVVSSRDYAAVGGYPPWPLMEDVALVRALGRRGPVRVLPAGIRVSARRWERDGVLRRTFANWWLLARFVAGVPPARLARSYRPGPDAP